MLRTPTAEPVASRAPYQPAAGQVAEDASEAAHNGHGYGANGCPDGGAGRRCSDLGTREHAVTVAVDVVENHVDVNILVRDVLMRHAPDLIDDFTDVRRDLRVQVVRP
jgi:hypothetical protein